MINCHHAVVIIVYLAVSYIMDAAYWAIMSVSIANSDKPVLRSVYQRHVKGLKLRRYRDGKKLRELGELP